MIPIIGIVIVLGAIAAGYGMEHGKFLVLMQPAEFVIIGGAALGTVVVANPLPTLIKIGKGLAGVFGGNKFTKALYLETLKMLYELFALSRKAGTAKLEEEVDNPSKGQVFNKYPKFLKSHHALHFLCDTLRMAVSGTVEPIDIDSMMEADLEVHHRESLEPIAALSTMADALPGLGIVAAVLGVVLTNGRAGRDRRKPSVSESGGGTGRNLSRYSPCATGSSPHCPRRWEKTMTPSRSSSWFCAWRLSGSSKN